MRAHEFITENVDRSKLLPDQADALPATYVIPKLSNNDAYLQYRFGVAIAGAKGKKQRESDGISSLARQSAFGENEVVVSYDTNVEEWIDDALEQLGMSPSDKKLISTPTSIETKDVGKKSPMQSFKGYDK